MPLRERLLEELRRDVTELYEEAVRPHLVNTSGRSRMPARSSPLPRRDRWCSFAVSP
jgi:hypothetical protein